MNNDTNDDAFFGILENASLEASTVYVDAQIQEAYPHNTIEELRQTKPEEINKFIKNAIDKFFNMESEDPTQYYRFIITELVFQIAELEEYVAIANHDSV